MKIPRYFVPLLAVIVLVLVILSVSQSAEKSPSYVEGTVSIDRSLEGKAQGSKALFIALFDQDSPIPMPYGAVKMDVFKTPKGAFAQFIVTKENLKVMDPSRPFPKNLRIKARLNMTGNVTGGTGDLIGIVENIPVGSKEVGIQISKVL